MKIHELKEKIESEINAFKSELGVIRTGRATVSLVEDIKVAAYEGTPALPVKELATITIPEPAVIVIQPWDLSLIPRIEKAVRASLGGFNPVVFDDLVRVPVPPLSEERRRQLVKTVSVKAEAAKVEVRQIRQDEMRSIDEMEKNGVLSKDERFKAREEVEKIIKEKTEEIESLARLKEADLLRM